MTAKALGSVDLFRTPTDWVKAEQVEKCNTEYEMSCMSHMLCHEFVSQFFDEEIMDGYLLRLTVYDMEPSSFIRDFSVMVKLIDEYPSIRVVGIDKEYHHVDEKRYMYGDMYTFLYDLGYHDADDLYATMELVDGPRADMVFEKYASLVEYDC